MAARPSLTRDALGGWASGPRWTEAHASSLAMKRSRELAQRADVVRVEVADDDPRDLPRRDAARTQLRGCVTGGRSARARQVPVDAANATPHGGPRGRPVTAVEQDYAVVAELDQRPAKWTLVASKAVGDQACETRMHMAAS